jgi:hypothetical protein
MDTKIVAVETTDLEYIGCVVDVSKTSCESSNCNDHVDVNDTIRVHVIAILSKLGSCGSGTALACSLSAHAQFMGRRAFDSVGAVLHIGQTSQSEPTD